MNRGQVLDGLDLNHNGIADQQIDAITFLERGALVFDIQCLLTFEGQLPECQFPGKTRLVN